MTALREEERLEQTSFSALHQCRRFCGRSAEHGCKFGGRLEFDGTMPECGLPRLWKCGKCFSDGM